MAGLLVAAPLFVYPLFLMKALCFALFALSVNLLLGYVGLLSFFGHAMFLGSAGYVSAHSAKVWGWTPELAIIAGIARRRHARRRHRLLAIGGYGIYFAMTTLAFSQMVFFLAVQAKFTGGEDGIQGVPRGVLLACIDLQNQMAMYFVVLAIFLGGSADLSDHPLAVRRSLEGDPRERGARHVARIQDGTL